MPLPVTVRVLNPGDGRRLLGLLNQALEQAPYSSPMDEEAIQEEIFRLDPPTVHPMQWHRHLQLGAWQGDALVGFLDAAVGLDSEALHTDSLEPVGLIRFVALPQEGPIREATALLFQMAEHFWRESQVETARAFAFSSGYPSFQSGIGVLPGDWNVHFRILTEAGYRLKERYYCMRLPLRQFLNEKLPGLPLQLASQTVRQGRRYQLLHEREEVAEARVYRRSVTTPKDVNPVAYLAELQVKEEWRGQGIAKWLLRRVVNDAYQQGCQEMALHVSHSDDVAIRLFTQQGFEDLNYRGYVLEKQL